MKKHLFSIKLFALSFLLSNSAFGQHDLYEVCTSDIIQERLFENNPELRIQYEAKQNEFKSLKLQGKLQSKTNQIFEIPVVVHVLNDGTGKYLPTTEQIKSWIDRTNSIFDGTAIDIKGPSEGGTTLPIKLVLAQRTPDNKTTNGILVHDLSSNSAYVNYGVDGNGLSNSYLAKNFGWDSNSYYNVYVTNYIDGINPTNTTTGSYTAGYAYYPGSSLDLSVMLYHVATNAKDTTFGHELMHALNVAHPFNGGDGNGATCGTDNNDGIADTQNIRSGLWFGNPNNKYNQYTTYPTVGLTINDCTNTPFDNTLYNIMTYGRNRDRFTVGQGEMALAAINYFRTGYLTSKALTPATNKSEYEVKSACKFMNITGVSGLEENQTYSIGMQVVKLGTINNSTSLHSGPSPKFYNDYTVLNEINSIYRTELDINKEHTITLGANSNNNITYTVYIDQNNDGNFSSDELVVDKVVLTKPATRKLVTTTATFKLLPNAVKNVPLRMRIIGDSSSATFGACDDRIYGEVEDYTVIVTDSTLSTSDVDTDKLVTIYVDGKNAVVKSNELIDVVDIYDINGRIVNTFKNINKAQTTLHLNAAKGVLVVNIKLKNGQVVTKKIVVK